MVKQTALIQNPTGLHARPAAIFSQTAKRYKASVKIAANGTTVNGKSVVSILTAGISSNTQVELIVEGADEAEAMGALLALIEAGCGE